MFISHICVDNLTLMKKIYVKKISLVDTIHKFFGIGIVTTEQEPEVHPISNRQFILMSVSMISVIVLMEKFLN